MGMCGRREGVEGDGVKRMDSFKDRSVGTSKDRCGWRRNVERRRGRSVTRERERERKVRRIMRRVKV